MIQEATQQKDVDFQASENGIIRRKKPKNPLEGINLERGYLTEREVNLLKLRLNSGKLRPDEISFPEDGFKLSPEQTRKGLNWLMNQWKTPRGIERQNNPFGYREQDAIENFKEFRLIDFYNATNYYQEQMGIRFYIPLYEVIGKENCFQYYVSSGECHIVG